MSHQELGDGLLGHGLGRVRGSGLPPSLHFHEHIEGCMTLTLRCWLICRLSGPPGTCGFICSPTEEGKEESVAEVLCSLRMTVYACAC